MWNTKAEGEKTGIVLQLAGIFVPPRAALTYISLLLKFLYGEKQIRHILIVTYFSHFSFFCTALSLQLGKQCAHVFCNSMLPNTAPPSSGAWHFAILSSKCIISFRGLFPFGCIFSPGFQKISEGMYDVEPQERLRPARRSLN